MSGNTIGKCFKLTSFGESHGKGIGVVIDGCPAGIKLDYDFINTEMQRIKPGQSKIVTQRKEEDEVEIQLSMVKVETVSLLLVLPDASVTVIVQSL